MSDSEGGRSGPKPRRFEFRGDESEKFWTIVRDSDTYTVTFGKIGTNGRSQTKEFDDDEEAIAAVEKLVGEKVKKGYVEVGGLPPVAGTDWTRPDSWRALREAIDLVPPTRGEPATPPTPADLDAFQSAYNVRLPPSYRAFAEVFGPGEVNGMFRVATPRGPEHHNLELLAEKARTDAGFEEADSTFTRSEQEAGRRPITRMIVFCAWDSDRWGWDPEDPRPGGEFAVRNWPRSYYAAQIVAESFPEFVIDKLFRKGLGDWAGQDQPSFTPAAKDKAPKSGRKS